MSGSESGLIFGAKKKSDGTWDYSSAVRVQDHDGSMAIVAQTVELKRRADRERKYAIPKDAQPGTAQKVWYEIRNARLLQEEALEKDPNNTRAAELIGSFRLKHSLLQELDEAMNRELSQQAGSVDTREEVRKKIVYASALQQEAILTQRISEWEDEVDRNPVAYTTIGGNRYPISSVLTPARELSLQLLREAEKYKIQEVPLPKHWTFLVHGSNLDKSEWQDSGSLQLDADVLEVKGLGLSTVDKAEQDERQKELDELTAKGVSVGGYNTTRNYSTGASIPLEIRVVFPAFHSRQPLSAEQQAKLVEKYGEAKVKALYELADMVQWKTTSRVDIRSYLEA